MSEVLLGAFSVIAHSRHLVADLAHHGITPAKSRTLRLSDQAAAQPATWLGVLDGDGWVNPATADGPRIVLCGTHALMCQWSTFVDRHLPRRRKPPAVYRTNKGCDLWAVALVGASAQRIAELLLASHPHSLEANARSSNAPRGTAAATSTLGAAAPRMRPDRGKRA